MRKTFDADTLRELLCYDEHTGVFTRRISNRRWLAGTEAGSIDKDGYRLISLKGCQMPAHRLAVLYMTGKMPEHGVDHKNGVKDDNRYQNLRQATQAENMQNERGARANNKCGLPGVCRRRDNGKYCAEITVAGKHIHLGSAFTTEEEASLVYREAKVRLHPFQTLVEDV